jgi:hypothetical protein
MKLLGLDGGNWRNDGMAWMAWMVLARLFDGATRKPKLHSLTMTSTSRTGPELRPIAIAATHRHPHDANLVVYS